MGERLRDLLGALPAPSLDIHLDQLEPAVWARIEARRASAAPAGLRLQLAAAGMALAVGLALGWSMSTSSQASESQNQSLLYASYADVGPIGRLEGGL